VISFSHTATKEDFAKSLLESRVYRGVKTMDDALFVTDLLIEAYRNYTYTPEPQVPFPCKNTGRSPTPPTLAKALKPGDVDLVCGLGDSLTAGFGALATSFFDLFTDYRACSFSTGVHQDLNTLPASLLTFNPALTGFSIGNGNENSPASRLNVAVTGAISEELGPQVSNLKSKLASFEPKLWKHVSLFIGGNDLCDSCNDPDKFSRAVYKANVQAAITSLKELTNVIVSLILPPDVTLLSELTGGLCSILRPFECSCNEHPNTSPLHKEYSKALHEIENDPQNSRPDFFVTCQPFLELIHIPQTPDGEPDMTYFAPDCFHFSAKAHSVAGLALWNNLMESPQDKKRAWIVGEPFECPTDDQFLQ